MISYSNKHFSVYRSYCVVIKQAQTNYEWIRIRHDKSLCDKLPFYLLRSLLHRYLTKDLKLNLQFVQLFEISSLGEIELNYKNKVAQQFIIEIKRQGGFINANFPCLIYSQFNHKNLFIPSEITTQRIMNNDERLYFNIIFIYYDLWKNILIKKKQSYLKEINENDKKKY